MGAISYGTSRGMTADEGVKIKSFDELVAQYGGGKHKFRCKYCGAIIELSTKDVDWRNLRKNYSICKECRESKQWNNLKVRGKNKSNAGPGPEGANAPRGKMREFLRLHSPFRDHGPDPLPAHMVAPHKCRITRRVTIRGAETGEEMTTITRK